MKIPIDPIHKWRLIYFCSVIVQISLPSLALEQEFFSFSTWQWGLVGLFAQGQKNNELAAIYE